MWFHRLRLRPRVRATMPASEFEIIERYFTWPASERREIVLGVGDDAAELALGSDRLLLDVTQVQEGRDFAAGDDAASVAHRLLAAAAAKVSARGARPLAFTLALSLPDADEAWLQSFSQGLAGFARTHDIALIGGDTTRGPRSAVIHLHGTLAADQAPVPAADAGTGDLIYVSGVIGDAALAVLHSTGELQLARAEREAAEQAWRFPDICSDCGAAIVGVASSAVAVTTTLAEGLESLLETGHRGATIQVQRLPLGPALRNNLERAGGWNLAVHGPALGPLCFTVPVAAQAAFEQHNSRLDPPCTWIGMVERRTGIRWQLDDGSEL